ncbi:MULTISPECIES: dienelactone hydrolase family protein [unclassified Colwellia]|uniref:dienelactone hydrolase family protein n=1 Tax=unclassified Colwellia TaxID=196834 RepID=UPI0015F47DC6|nr:MULTISPECIES: dienelactone hydrolase family protein [unclassified Colwellia]MBA6355044.1 dienelactone hydrolase family protein [Colwellia sp. BRX8-3]MBA6359720.1 dienelactone hydrolase family protein [Colwellia sp. BRX8-6]MBA6366946.1 dienelactone hydrolase family protein [Colwellia sp. BRX8-5]MBA6374116.1 dienelactone hydrolase family protein [Colwellia sp. BRX8-2]
MSKKSASDIPQEAFDWYDEYAHGGMDRRSFMAKLATLVAVGYSMTVLTSALLPNYALAEQVSFNDDEIKASYETFDSPEGHGKGVGYLVTPTNKTGTLPVVLVIHENRGLNPYVKDVARRLAKAGYLAFAPDALFPLGGYPGNDDEGRSMQKSMDAEKIQHDFVAAAKFIKKHHRSNGKLGAVGFCFGGYIVNYLAAVESDLIIAGVPFYGTPAKKELRKNIKASLLIQLAELDERVNNSWPDYESDLKIVQAPYQMQIYKNAKHGFHNDSTSRYDKENAELAWHRTLAFFTEKLV